MSSALSLTRAAASATGRSISFGSLIGFITCSSSDRDRPSQKNKRP